MGGLRSPAMLAGLLCFALPAQAQEPAGVRARLEKARTDVEALQERYLRQPLLEREYAITARIADGQLFHLTHDYERAAMVLLDVVRRPGIENHPGYREAITYLADALFHLRNYRAASQWYEAVSKVGTLEQRQQALSRLLAIATATHQEADALHYLERAHALLNGSPDPGLFYAVGRFHYQRNQLDQAVEAFAAVPASHPEWFRARYHLGVVEVRRGKYAQALEIFKEVIARGETTPELEDGQRVAIDDARLATGRIHYELGELTEAVAAYAAVPRDSHAFEEALNESVWISIKQGDFEKALRKLEIQLIAQPDIIQGPDARLLQGKLLLMLGRYEEATRAFREVLFEFEPIQAEMKGLVKKGDLVAHFNEVIDRGIADFDLTTFLPARAAEFAGSDPDADRALRLVAELGAQRRDLDDMNRTIQHLDTALSAPNRIERRPRLREGWLKAAELRSAMIEARAAILDGVAGGLDARQADYTALRKARQAAGQRYAEVPRSVSALLTRQAKADDALRRIDVALFELDLNIRGMEAQLVAINRFLEDRARVEGPSRADTPTSKAVRAELAEAQAMREKLRVVVEDLNTQRIRLGVGDEASVRDERARLDYLAAVEAETAWLRARGVALPAELLSLARDVDTRARAFQKAAETLVDEWVGDARRQIDDERRNVQGYQTDLARNQTEAETLGGAIAAGSYLHVLGRIDDLVLESDVGLIDVAWKQKQDESDQITRLLDRQTADLKALEQTWREVRGD